MAFLSNKMRRESAGIVEPGNQIKVLPQIKTDCDNFETFTCQLRSSPLARKFSSVSLSDMIPDSRRRYSFASSMTSTTDGIFSTSSSDSMSPTTPITATAAEMALFNHNLKPASGHDCNLTYSFPECESFGSSESWMSDTFTTPNITQIQQFGGMVETEPLSFHDSPFLCNDYANFLVGINNPALSRSIFSEVNQPHIIQPAAHSLPVWPSSITESPPQTIAPSAAFQPGLSSSPAFRQDPMTPRRANVEYSTPLDSSPLSLMSPVIVPSQHDVEEHVYDSFEQLVPSIGVKRHRIVAERLHKRTYERKRLTGNAHRSRSVTSKSGIDCEVVITQNEFACSYPGCIDKATTKQKRFKRQEHKKRHERTVHEKNTHGVHKCWVPLCKTQPFTRTDNLKSHLKNTHGKRSANQRNRYVATQDRHSDFYDPDWIGDLTQDGFPIR